MVYGIHVISSAIGLHFLWCVSRFQLILLLFLLSLSSETGFYLSKTDTNDWSPAPRRNFIHLYNSEAQTAIVCSWIRDSTFKFDHYFITCSFFFFSRIQSISATSVSINKITLKSERIQAVSRPPVRVYGSYICTQDQVARHTFKGW